jgi:hypothetical protein
VRCRRLFLLAALAGCVCDRAGSADAAGGGLLARKLPRIAYRGGPFVRNPQLVTITFANDDPRLVSRLEEFGRVIARSDWWHAVTDGYCSRPGACIGDGRAGPPVHLDEALPTDVRAVDIEALLRREAKTGRLGPIDESALWLVYLPAGINLSDETTRYCTGKARAFHRSLDLDGVRVAFAVLPRCGNEGELTGSASHEILEATTNPFPAARGFAFPTGSEPSGFSAAGLEPVDPCGLVTMDAHRTIESGFVVHRAWSNRAAALGRDPCVPSPSDEPYVMVVPRQPAVRLARVGETVTVDFDATTTGNANTWSVSAFDLSGYLDDERYVEVVLDRRTIAAGQHTKLSITARKNNSAQRAIVAVVSTLGSHSHMWPLLVMMR